MTEIYDGNSSLIKKGSFAAASQWQNHPSTDAPPISNNKIGYCYKVGQILWDSGALSTSLSHLKQVAQNLMGRQILKILQ
jgi:hypothetical protein